MSPRLALIVIAATLAGCADTAPAGDTAPTDVPTIAVIRCEADGSTTIDTPQVLAGRDGIHVRVVSRLDEWASINEWGFDVGPGTSRWTFGARPGVVQTACWPFSDHRAEEPATQPIEVLDPEGLFVDGELECEDGMAMAWTADYASEADDAPLISLDDARAMLRGLEPADEVRYSGYPDEPQRGVIVVRDGRVIAAIGFARFDGDWSSPGGRTCDADGVRVAEG